MVRDTVPGSSVTLAANAGPDLRNYRVDFGKLVDTFPDLCFRWHVADGVRELLDSYTTYGLTYEDFTSSMPFVNDGRTSFCTGRISRLVTPTGSFPGTGINYALSTMTFRGRRQSRPQRWCRRST